MSQKKSNIILFKSVLILSSVVFLISCQSFPGGQKDKVVPESNRILLQPDGPHSGVWDSPHVVINYTYRLKNGEITLSSDVLLKTELLQGFEKVYLMSITAYFLDNTGNILFNKIFLNWNRPDHIDRWTVSRSFSLSKKVSAISFGYTGDLRDGLKESAILDLYYFPTEAPMNDKQ